jgi:hypothetical protein
MSLGKNQRKRNSAMDVFFVSMVTDLDEEVSVSVEAMDFADAEAIGKDMLERGELDCEGQICVYITSYQL